MGTLLCKEEALMSQRLSTARSLESSNCSTSRRPSLMQNYPQQNYFVFDQICFDSRFEAGNLLHAEKAEPNRYNLWIASDCYKTPNEGKYRIWFYFSVSNLSLNDESNTYTFKIKNMSKALHQNYVNGMVPVYSAPSTNYEWKYLPTPLKEVKLIKSALDVTFEYSFTAEDVTDKVFFAFSFPYTYTQGVDFLAQLEKNFCNHPDIYFHKELLTHSLEGRNIDLLTITAHDPSIFSARQSPEQEPLLDNLFPNHSMLAITPAALGMEDSIQRPYIFRRKRYILISARVNACEAPGNYMLEGFLKALLNKSDPTSRILLQNFVFVVIPMLNPDGVYRGHFRTDSKGNNLDRVYNSLEENWKSYPSIYALSKIAKSLCDGRLVMYLDLHAHISKNSGFIVGENPQDLQERTETRLFAALFDVYSKNFNANSCVFKNLKLEEEMNRDAKSEMIRKADLTHSYRLECGYYKGTKDPERYGRQNTEKNLEKEVEGKLDIKAYEEIGAGLRHVLLEVFAEHPNSQVAQTWLGSVQNIRNTIYEALSKEKDEDKIEALLKFDLSN